jgi:hypothetical protein
VSPPTPLRKLEPEPVAAVVALLEEVLERARAGEIIGVGVVVACSGRADATSYTIGEGNIASLVLACRRLERRLLDHEDP